MTGSSPPKDQFTASVESLLKIGTIVLGLLYVLGLLVSNVQLMEVGIPEGLLRRCTHTVQQRVLEYTRYRRKRAAPPVLHTLVLGSEEEPRGCTCTEDNGP